MSGPVAKSLVLSDHERSVLAGWIRRPTSSARLVQRSQIVMAYADSGSVADVARRVGVSAPTVSKWRDRFLVNRLDGLEDAPRPGQPRGAGVLPGHRPGSGPRRGARPPNAAAPQLRRPAST